MNQEQMIEDPESWPCYPFLPMVHNTERADSGLAKQGLLYNDGEPNTVYEANLYDTTIFGGEITQDQFLNEIQRQTYESIRALLEDWRID